MQSPASSQRNLIDHKSFAMTYLNRAQQIVNYILVILLTCATIAWLDTQAAKSFPVRQDQRLIQLAALQVATHAVSPARHK